MHIGVERTREKGKGEMDGRGWNGSGKSGQDSEKKKIYWVVKTAHNTIYWGENIGGKGKGVVKS